MVLVVAISLLCVFVWCCCCCCCFHFFLILLICLSFLFVSFFFIFTHFIHIQLLSLFFFSLFWCTARDRRKQILFRLLLVSFVLQLSPCLLFPNSVAAVDRTAVSRLSMHPRKGGKCCLEEEGRGETLWCGVRTHRCIEIFMLYLTLTSFFWLLLCWFPLFVWRCVAFVVLTAQLWVSPAHSCHPSFLDEREETHGQVWQREANCLSRDALRFRSSRFPCLVLLLLLLFLPWWKQTNVEDCVSVQFAGTDEEERETSHTTVLCVAFVRLRKSVSARHVCVWKKKIHWNIYTHVFYFSFFCVCVHMDNKL